MRKTVALSLAASCCALVTACGSSGSSGPPISISSPATQGFRGATFQPAKLLPAATLTDTAGQPWNFLRNGAGKVTVTYFGYTNCPDACPQDMAALASAIRRLPVAAQKQVQVVFVTVDPKRDTRQAIRAFLDRNAKGVPPFVGLRGSAAQLTTVAHKLGLQFTVTTNSRGLEQVEHSSQMTAFDKTGTANLVWLDQTPPSDIAHDMQLLINGVTPA